MNGIGWYTHTWYQMQVFFFANCDGDLGATMSRATRYFLDVTQSVNSSLLVSLTKTWQSGGRNTFAVSALRWLLLQIRTFRPFKCFLPLHLSSVCHPSFLNFLSCKSYELSPCVLQRVLPDSPQLQDYLLIWTLNDKPSEMIPSVLWTVSLVSPDSRVSHCCFSILQIWTLRDKPWVKIQCLHQFSMIFSDCRMTCC